jgi:hypothetical protein
MVVIKAPKREVNTKTREAISPAGWFLLRIAKKPWDDAQRRAPTRWWVPEITA